MNLECRFQGMKIIISCWSRQQVMDCYNFFFCSFFLFHQLCDNHCDFIFLINVTLSIFNHCVPALHKLLLGCLRPVVSPALLLRLASSANSSGPVGVQCACHAQVCFFLVVEAHVVLSDILFFNLNQSVNKGHLAKQTKGRKN